MLVAGLVAAVSGTAVRAGVARRRLAPLPHLRLPGQRACRVLPGRQLLQPGEPVADREEVFVVGTARGAGRQMPSYRLALLRVQHADGVCAEITAPFGAALVHPFPFFPGWVPASLPLVGRECASGDD